MSSSVLELPSYKKRRRQRRAVKVPGRVVVFSSAPSVENWLDETKDVVARRDAHFSLWNKVKEWHQFYVDRLREVEKDQSVIGTYFKDLEQATDELDNFIDTTNECVSWYRRITGDVHGVSREEISGLVSSLEDLVGVCQGFRWYVGIYVGLQQPRSAEPCESAEDFVQKMRSSIAEFTDQT